MDKNTRKKNKKTGEKKKNEGNSQFTRSKLEQGYNPTYRPIKHQKSPYQNFQIFQKKQKTDKLHKQFDEIFSQMKHQLQSGNDIVIDWSKKLSFRSTKFPKINSQHVSQQNKGRSLSLGSMLNSSLIKSDSKNKQTYKSNQSLKMPKKFSNFSSDKPNRQKKYFNIGKQSMVSQKDKNPDLMSDYQVHDSIRYRKKQKKAKFYTEASDNSNSISLLDQKITNSLNFPTDKFTTIQKMKLEEKNFFKLEQKNIIQAIKYESNISKHIDQLLKETQGKTRKKSKIEFVHQRIIQKSKLTLLKSDLLKKLKEIREKVIEQ